MGIFGVVSGGRLLAGVMAAVIVLGILSGDGGLMAVAPEASAPEAGGPEVANCRYGATLDKDSGFQRWVDDLGAGWWHDFQVNYETTAENGAEYVHMIWVEQNRSSKGVYLDSYTVNPEMARDSLGYLIEKRPGRLWIVGAEVDRGPDPGQIEGGQGDTMPAMYARIYHDVYYYIKEWDPTALVTPSALVQVTPGRMQYLDMVWEAYEARYGETMPADVCNMDLYILPELTPGGGPSYYANVALGTDPGLGMYDSGGNGALCVLDHVYCLAEHDDMAVFAEQVVRMRQWMKEHGQQDKPLIITEYSLLLPYQDYGGSCWVMDEYGQCFTPERVRDFAAASFEYLETAADPTLGYGYDDNRLVQQWMWYSVYRTGLGAPSNLEADGLDPLELTPAGQVFYDMARARPAAVNLVATAARDALAATSGGNELRAEVAVGMRNNGNRPIEGAISVTFYSDEGLTEVIGTATVPAAAPEVEGGSVGMTGCAVREVWATTEAVWVEGLGPGEYLYWARVDSGALIDEGDETDNVVSGVITVVPKGGYLPLVTG